MIRDLAGVLLIALVLTAAALLRGNDGLAADQSQFSRYSRELAVYFKTTDHVQSHMRDRGEAVDALPAPWQVAVAVDNLLEVVASTPDQAYAEQRHLFALELRTRLQGHRWPTQNPPSRNPQPDAQATGLRR